ncbi:MAG: chemotaxis protein, partial [Nitrosopumilaceae archaeon]|nr:chemotaxis protein [Nitrosopumilaceae archaeon]
MATKTTKKKTTSKAKKVTKREPSPSILLKKVASVSDSNKALQKEIKVMSKIFGENQKVLVSMKGMIDSLTSALEHIQKQSKQLNIIEDDTQKLYAGLNQVRTQSSIVDKINNQTIKLQEEINRISEEQKLSKPHEISQQVEDSMNSIRNNSQMIIKIAQRIDEVRDDLRKVSGKTDSFLEVGLEIDKLKNTIEEV